MSERYDRRSQRGYYGLGLIHPKFKSNTGVLWRTAFNLGADFIFTVGKRYQYRADVVKSYKHIPMYEYEEWEEVKIPKQCSLVGVEICDDSKCLFDFKHPERAVYLLGAEDSGISEDILAECDYRIEIPCNYCLNVSCTGAIVMAHRMQQNMLSNN